MSSNIFADLANASKALTAQRFGVTTAGTNLANVNNPDYARQRVIIGEDGVTQTLYGPKGLGVEVQGFEHARDVVLDREVLREASIKASLESQQAALSKAEANLGQEIDRTGDAAFIDGSTDSMGSGGIAETLNDFFNQLHSLSANPGSDAEKEALIQKAQILTEKFNVTAERFSDLKEDLTLQVQTDLKESNALLKEIGRLNAEIARAEANHAGQALSLRDQRQALLEDLSEFMQVKTEDIDGSAGQIRVFVPLNDGTGSTIDLVNRGNYEKILFNDDGVTPSFTVEDSGDRIQIKGGSIHGLLKARDGSISTFERNLDDMAATMVEQINALYSDGGADTDFFEASGTSALTMRLASTLNSGNLRTATAADSTGAGDNSLVLAMAELDSVNLDALGNRSFSSYYRSIVTDLGEDTANATARLEDEGVVFKLLKEQQDSVSGVSIDEEMTDMMKYQRAFEANAKMIKAIDEMLEIIVNRLI